MKLPSKSILAMWLAVNFCMLYGCAAPSKQLEGRIGRTKAIEIVSQLHVGMHEEEAVRFLVLNGLTDDVIIGDSFGWVHDFYLADGSTLLLAIQPKPFSPDGRWINGRVVAATIEKNGRTITSIKLMKLNEEIKTQIP